MECRQRQGSAPWRHFRFRWKFAFWAQVLRPVAVVEVTEGPEAPLTREGRFDSSRSHRFRNLGGQPGRGRSGGRSRGARPGAGLLQPPGQRGRQSARQPGRLPGAAVTTASDSWSRPVSPTLAGRSTFIHLGVCRCPLRCSRYWRVDRGPKGGQFFLALQQSALAGHIPNTPAPCAAARGRRLSEGGTRLHWRTAPCGVLGSTCVTATCCPPRPTRERRQP